ncbi:MAG TPA: HEAT repeat domain-containing protein [Sedimentisphaerales bacterium]|nr:HEAT repeat domain-containing protein [Sedimentisphaerales bacterium]
MSKRRTISAILIATVFLASTGFAQSLEDHWKDFVHYVKIGHSELAKGFAQAILQSNPDPVELLALSKASPEDYQILKLVYESKRDAELADLVGKVLSLIDKGTFTRRTDAPIIAEEVRRLTGTERGWVTAVKRLQAAGEYAIPFMFDAMTDSTRSGEYANIVRALPYIGNDAIRPLVVALHTDNVAVKGEIIKALGKIGYPQSQGYLKYIAETDESPALRSMAGSSLAQIDPSAAQVPAARLFYKLAEDYYYHAESLAPQEDADFGNLWFWNPQEGKLERVEVDKGYFYELMSMRACEWALRADPTFGQAIGLWVAAFFKAESAGVEMPAFFGPAHADALVYATTAGVQYLHQALARAVKDNNAYVALGVVEALATTAGEKSLLYRIGTAQPLMEALRFNNRAVRYSAAIAIASAGPTEKFAESKLVIANLAQAIGPARGGAAGSEDTMWSEGIANTYAVRAATAMLKLAESRNSMIELPLAQQYLAAATNDKRPEIQILAGKVLAYLDSPDAQRAIAAMALAEGNSPEVRVAAFESLATSAKLNACMLVDQMVDGIYALISSDQTDPDLRSAAAAAYGALNLPSQKVKDLILDQAKK